MDILNNFDGKINGIPQTFSGQQTSLLCSYIENYLKENGIGLQYISSGKSNKNEIVCHCFSQNVEKAGVVTAFPVVQLCNTMTVRPDANNIICTILQRCRIWLDVLLNTDIFPYNAQIYINRRKLPFNGFDNKALR